MTIDKTLPTTPVAVDPVTGQLRQVRRPTRRGGTLMTPKHTATMVIVDVVLATSALLIGLLLVASLSTVDGNSMANYWTNVTHDIWFPVGVLTGLAFAGTYRLNRRSASQSTFGEMNNFFFAIGAGGILSMLYASIVHRLFGTRQANPTHIIAAILVASILIPIGRSLVRTFALRRNPVRVIIVDSGRNVGRIRTHLRISHGFEVLGWVSATKEKAPDAIGGFDHLDELCQQSRADQVIVASFDIETDVVVDMLRKVQDLVQLSVVPRVFELVSWRSQLTELSGLPVLDTASPNLTIWDRLVKRSFDLVVAIMTLVVLAIPMLIVAIGIKTTSKGPVFYRQTRLGRDRVPFTILKFRTMVDEPHAAPRQHHEPGADAPLHEARGKHHESTRITRIGRFLRKVGLDEVPQLLNVAAGSMSIVGPRPFVSHESEPATGWQARRYEVRPGITGLWQVSGRNELSGEELRQLDYLYVTSWSMWWDVKIMWDTPRTMFRGLGAY